MVDMLVLETNDLGHGGSIPSTCNRMTERFKVSDLKSEVAYKTTVSSNLTPACWPRRYICSSI